MRLGDKIKDSFIWAIIKNGKTSLTEPYHQIYHRKENTPLRFVTGV